ncbi:hypothetical protein [Microbulbifer aggregans]|uniref:hypothetical protein n=1 Tax=Microbulbifer aggregans TaxID=1769779 RepID=UPI001CFE46C3|nr:hypothetical protein [Microbulbifer aggregans]
MKRNVTSLPVCAVLILASISLRALSGEAVGTENGFYSEVGQRKDWPNSLVVNSSSLSEECFVPIAALNDSYIYVDVSQRPPLSVFPSNSLHLPIHRVKANQFLKTRRVAIGAESYKRFELAALCQELRQSGFDKPLIAVWNPSDIPSHPPVPVSADHYLVEAQRFSAVTIVPNKAVSDQLQKAGITAIYPGEGISLEQLIKQSIEVSSLNRYLPVFYIEDTEGQVLSTHDYKAVHFVEGGIQSVIAALEIRSENALRRSGEGFRGVCAN